MAIDDHDLPGRREAKRMDAVWWVCSCLAVVLGLASYLV